jgi:hypothetical protein
MKKATNRKAAQADRAVKFNKAERTEMIEAAQRPAF